MTFLVSTLKNVDKCLNEIESALLENESKKKDKIHHPLHNCSMLKEEKATQDHYPNVFNVES